MDLPQGQLVRLRDVTLDDADMLDAWEGELHGSGGFNDLGQAPRSIDREALATGPLRSERNGMLIVERIADTMPLGHVGWRRVGYGPTERSDAWSIGIELRPTARGQGFGTEAQRLVALYLFATTGANRIEASTDVENLAEQRSLEKAGYRREGVTRGAQFRAGSYHDLVTYAVLREDGEA